ncbi:zinc finger protein 76 [Diaporthe eres]|nr:zinc finger protein 76 [Diaporthe eres]
MATPAIGGSQSQDLGTVLRDWVTSHDGRLWQTREETSETIKKTGCGQTQVKNWFDYQRKQAKLALARALETPEVFLSEHDYEAAKTLKSAFAHAATTGYLAEPAKSLLAESTGLSDRAVINFILKYHQKPEFAGIAAGIANVELRDPSTMADTTQRTDISISQRLPTSSVTGTRSAAPMQVSQSSRTSSPLQVECDAVTLSTTAPTDVASHATTKFSKEPNRIHTTLPDGRSLFGWNRGHQVNLTIEVVPLLSSFPGVESATCFSSAQRLIGFVTPLLFLQAVSYSSCNTNGVVDFKALRVVAEQPCSPKSTAAGANGCHYCDASFSTAPLAVDHLLYYTGPFHVCDDHIIRLPYLFRHNLQPPKGITCGLEFLFSIIFSEHPLCSTHHDALVDSRKLVLMALLAESLCNGDRTADTRLENSIFCLRG